MPSYEIPVAVLPALSYALESIHSDIPAKYDKVSKYLHGFISKNPGTMNSTCIKIGKQGTVVSFDPLNKTNLRKIHQLLIQSPTKESILQMHDGFSAEQGSYPWVFIPDEKLCTTCDATLITEGRPSIISVYTNNGLQYGNSYHKKCTHCRSRYYHSYIVNSDGAKIIRVQCTEHSHFMISSQTAFEVAYLRATCDLVEGAAVSFTAASECYETTHGVALERQRLEEAYFLWRLILLHRESKSILCIDKRDESCRMNIELLCKKASDSANLQLEEFVDHTCKTKGCAEGFAMADGIEKIHRRVCAAPHTAIKLTRFMPKTVTVCPETPDLGNHSKYCSSHIDLHKDEEARKKPRIVVSINCNDLTVSTRMLPSVNDLPTNSDLSVHNGCKKPDQVNRFYERTAGVLAMVRPCGTIIHCSEMFSCESPTQLFIQLLRLKCDTKIHLKYLGYDRACEFEPYLVNLKKKGNAGAELLLEDVQFLVDKFHIKGHTTPACDLESDQCRYHPDLQKFKDIQDVNTECAEQAFAWLGKFKQSSKYMSHYMFKFFLYRIVRARNEKIAMRLKKSGLA